MLTKGPIAIVLLSITALLCLLHPKTRAATLQLRWGQGAGIVLAIAAPWFLTMWYRFGPRFIDQYVLYNNLSLFGRPLYRSNRYPFFYGRVFLTGFLPWSPHPPGAHRRHRPLAHADTQPSLRRVRALCVGRDGDRLFQPVVVQARYLHLSRRAGDVPARCERVATGG